MKRISSAAMLCLLLLFAGSAAAQEQRGSIEGIVKDTSGAVLPGVTVEARSTGGVVVTATSDRDGAFRFPAVAPGDYDVTASLAGFNSRKFDRVQVLLGQIKTLQFVLSVAGVAETVQVTAESPLVDVRQSARATSIRTEQVDLLPKGRDYTNLVTQIAGANQETNKLGGISIDGASAGENRYLVDGAETTNLRNGTQATLILPDFVEEIQVKSSGYAAEYGGATGGVISMITKSGTNQWHGNGLFYFEGSALQADTIDSAGGGTTSGNPQILRLQLGNSDLAEVVKFKGDSYRRAELGFSLGGPLLKDKTWFYAAYQPTLRQYERTTPARTTGEAVTTVSKRPRQFFSANNTTQIGSNLRTRVVYNNSWSKEDGQLVNINGTDPIGTNYATGTTYPNWTMSGSADWVATSNFYMGFRGAYYTSDIQNFGIPSVDRYLFVTTNTGLAGVPADLVRATGFSSVPTITASKFDKQKRLAFQVDGTVYGNFAGRHTIKGGLQVDQRGNDVLSGEQGNLIRLYWGRAFSGQQGPFGYYRVRTNGVNPQLGFITEGNVSTNLYGLFIQDDWTLNNRLTVNLGLRTESERVPAFAAGPGIPTNGIEFPFADKLGPRAGFAWDVKGDGRWKAYGSWGIFYDIFKFELPRGSFGGDKWLEYFYTLDTPNWNTLGDAANCPPACPGTLLAGPIDFRRPSFGSDAIDPNLKPMKSQEASFGLEHQLSPVLAVSTRYIRKWLDRAVEDTGSLDAAGNEVYIIANPGFGLTELAFVDPNVPLPKAKRQYDAVEFAITKNLSNNYFLRASYLYSRLWGNYSGLSQSDENGRTSPNVGRAFDYPLMSFDQNAKPVYGLLGTDRPHQLKVQAIYQPVSGLTLGVYQNVSSGIPRTRELAWNPSSQYPLQYLGRASDGRIATYTQTDFLVQQEFKLAGDKRIQISLNVLNLFNQKNPVNYFPTENAAGTSINFNERAFYLGQTPNFETLKAQQGVPTDPRFLQNNAWQTPLNARFGVKFLF